MRDALNRTLLLMRTDLAPEAPEDRLLAALGGVTVAVIGDPAALGTHSGQTAFVTAALTLARSGHQVWLAAEDHPLCGAQPPLTGDRLIGGLTEAGLDLIPGLAFRQGLPADPPDLAVLIGDAAWPGTAGQICALQATDWAATMGQVPAAWRGGDWPVGALAAGALAAGEAFKIAMRKLRDLARSPGWFDDLYAPCLDVTVELASDGAPMLAALPDFDMVSGGAIGNALYYALLRLPGVSGGSRVLDDDRSAATNLNRNALLRRSQLDLYKVDDLAAQGIGLEIAPAPVRFSEGMSVRPWLLMGVDHVPSRWAAQRAAPVWLGVGATADFAVQVSSHRPGEACAGCLHPEDGGAAGDIPTVAFVSLWAGLMLAARFLQAAAGAPLPPDAQQTFFSALRPESWADAAMPVRPNPACPVCGGQGLRIGVAHAAE